MSAFRVLVATDRIGKLSSAEAGVALARGFAAVAQVAVVPLAASGPDLAWALGALAGVEPAVAGDRWVLRTPERIVLGLTQASGTPWSPELSSAALGEWLVANPADVPEVVLDLTGLAAHDGGAGLLQVAGEYLAGRRVVGLVAPDELSLPATGIRGGLARRAFAAKADVAVVLAADAALAEYAEGLGAGLATAPGGGAAGTVALGVLALGGELLSGTQFCHRVAGLQRTLDAADLVVTGCDELSALDRGGPVVAAVTEWASEAEKPCVLFTTGPGLSRRELRRSGIEAVHLLRGADPDAAELAAAAGRIASGWVPASGGLT